jgi:hypothetical protein
MRATRAEIFGHPDLSSAKEAKPTMARDPKDLTSSRLQSELYCELISYQTIDWD